LIYKELRKLMYRRKNLSDINTRLTRSFSTKRIAQVLYVKGHTAKSNIRFGQKQQTLLVFCTCQKDQ
jgi:hypothetical protein